MKAQHSNVRLYTTLKCDECGYVSRYVWKFGPRDFGCIECGHPVPPEVVKEMER
jgi:hypothetical protein